MKKLLGVPLLALVAAVLLALLPVVVSADSAVRFDATTPLAVVGAAQAVPIPGIPPMDTEAKFKLDRDGDIKRVWVKTTNEFVTGVPPGLDATCDPPDDPFCNHLDGAMFTSLHNSRVKIKNVVVDPTGYTLRGDIKGRLKGVVTITKANPADSMQGTMKLRIRGNAIYGCIASLIPFDPTPKPVAECQAGNGKLVPISLDIVDTGRLKINTTSGVFSDIKKARAKVEVTVSPTGEAWATISKGKAMRGDEDD